jgi:sortase A
MRTGRRRLLRTLSTILVVAGTVLLLDAGLTLVWQEPVTALLGRLNQNALGNDLDKLQDAGPTAAERRALARMRDERRRVAFLARALRRRTSDGQAVGRIRIPRADANFVVVKGTSAGDLRKGPGIYDQTPFPGVPGTVAMAGHRTTYLAPFRHLDRLRRGDPITVEMPYATFTYRVERTRIVQPDALWVLRRVRHDRLILSACHPLFSAAQRIVVFARLARMEPAGQPRGG